MANNTNWTATADVNWIKITPNSTISEKPNIKIDANSGDTRTGIVTFIQNGSNYVEKVRILQTKANFPTSSDEAFQTPFACAVVYDLDEIVDSSGNTKQVGDNLYVYRHDEIDQVLVALADPSSTNNNIYNFKLQSLEVQQGYGLKYYTIKNEYIIKDKKGHRKVVFFLISKIHDKLPNELEYWNGQIYAFIIPKGFTHLNDASLYGNSRLKKVIVGEDVNKCTSDCFAGLTGIEDIYFAPQTAPQLLNDNSEGYTFIDTVNEGDKLYPNKNCKLHIRQDAVGYGDPSDTSSTTSSTDIWKWPGCIRSTADPNRGTYVTDQLKRLDTWSFVRDYKNDDNLNYIKEIIFG